MFGPIKPSLYERLSSEGGISSSTMVVTQDVPILSTTSGVEERPLIPVAASTAADKSEQTLSTAPIVVDESTRPTSPTIVGDETLSPSPAETIAEEAPKEPCISFENDYDPTANLHSLARSLVRDRLAKGHDRSELLKEQFRLREKATATRRKKKDLEKEEEEEENDGHDGPLTGGGIWEKPAAPHDRLTPEYLFYTVVILTLEENPVVGTTHRGARSRFPSLPTGTSMTGGTSASGRAGE